MNTAPITAPPRSSADARKEMAGDVTLGRLVSAPAVVPRRLASCWDSGYEGSRPLGLQRISQSTREGQAAFRVWQRRIAQQPGIVRRAVQDLAGRSGLGVQRNT